MKQVLVPSSDSTIVSAVSWLEGVLLGTFATIIAVIAVASLGFLMLTGRIDVRRAMQVIVGSFMIFGASTIANGLLGAASGAPAGSYPVPPVVLPPPPVTLPPPTANRAADSSPFDPYAGASTPMQ